MSTIEAVYENGVFRPLGPVELPEHTRVAFEPRQLDPQPAGSDQGAVHEVLSRRYRSGHHDTAERHNDHQP
jgi:predicted DNA-binding antitoxin AbrB/MazE fold protein